MSDCDSNILTSPSNTSFFKVLIQQVIFLSHRYQHPDCYPEILLCHEPTRTNLVPCSMCLEIMSLELNEDSDKKDLGL